MLKQWKQAAAGALSVFAMVIVCGMQASAKPLYTNPETGYVVIVEDDADLLTSKQEETLAEQMKDITKWGNAGFISIDDNYTTAASYLEAYYREQFGRDSGIVFLIDMDNRKIWLKGDGSISQTVTSAYCDTITDNVYRYASKKNYFKCAQMTYKQINTLLSGNPIAQPMKYISNAFLAVILALILNYWIMRKMAKNSLPTHEEQLRHMNHRYSLTNARADYVNTTKTYDPVSSSSGGSSGGGGGGGGGSSGSSGGHSF